MLSVVMPNYNHAHYISEALEAILAQSFRPLEVIVVDDGSSDNSIEVIETFARRDRLVCLLRNERNMGVVFSANLGLEHAAGDYVYWVSADDRVLPGFFEKAMNLLAQHPQAGVCSALVLAMDEHGQDLGLIPTPVISRTPCFVSPEKAVALLLRHDSWIVDATTIFRRAAMPAEGLIPELRSHCSKFMSKVIALKYGACFIPEPLAVWRRTESCFSFTTGADPDAMLDIMHYAGQLMRSTYRDLFPPDYVDYWERRWLYGVCLKIVDISHTSREAQMADLGRLLPPLTLVDRVFLAGLRLSVEVEYRITRIYLLARLRPSDLWPAAAQKLKRFLGRE